MLYKRKALLLAKTETVYGTDALPAGANAIIVNDLEVKPAEGDKLKRDFLTPDMSTRPHIITNQHQAVSFGFEIKGGGAVDTPPECGPILRAAGFSETITALTSVAYQPVSEAFESSTMYVNIDGKLHKLPGCRGNVSFDFASGKYPTGKFSGLALQVAPADAAPDSPVYSTVKPLEVNNVNTTFSLAAFSAVLHQLTMDMGWQSKFRTLVNQQPEALLTDRDCKGSLVTDDVLVADKDWFAEWSAANALALALVHGTTPGNIIEVAAPKVQLDTLTHGDADGILTLNTPIALTRDLGDDEATLTFR